MTRITINGEPRTVSPGTTIGDVVSTESGRPLHSDGRARDGRGLGIAVAKNSEVVPRSRWFTEPLANGDAVELVTATQGG